MTIRNPSGIDSLVPEKTEQLFLYTVRTRLYQVSELSQSPGFLLAFLILWYTACILCYEHALGHKKTCRHLPRKKKKNPSSSQYGHKWIPRKQHRPFSGIWTLLRGRSLRYVIQAVTCHVVLTAQKDPWTALFSFSYYKDKIWQMKQDDDKKSFFFLYIFVIIVHINTLILSDNK